ncbi:MAG: cell wall anchor protein, partial [Alistipes sp.]|nr:cell wall anchor protein [Alistipes sp.]
FKQWLLDVWYAKNYWFIENHGGSNVCDLHYWPNWELANLASILAIGIYTDNVEMVNFVYKNFREGKGSGAINHMIP